MLFGVVMPKFINHDFDNEDYTKIDFVQSKPVIISEEYENNIENEVIAWQEIIKLANSELLH